MNIITDSNLCGTVTMNEWFHLNLYCSRCVRNNIIKSTCCILINNKYDVQRPLYNPEFVSRRNFFTQKVKSLRFICICCWNSISQRIIKRYIFNCYVFRTCYPLLSVVMNLGTFRKQQNRLLQLIIEFNKNNPKTRSIQEETCLSTAHALSARTVWWFNDRKQLPTNARSKQRWFKKKLE